MQNFELQFWDVGGCVGYPLSSKSILKVVSQMVRLCDYATVLFSYLHIGFLTFLALLKNTFWDGTPCIIYGLYHSLASDHFGTKHFPIIWVLGNCISMAGWKLWNEIFYRLSRFLLYFWKGSEIKQRFFLWF